MFVGAEALALARLQRSRMFVGTEALALARLQRSRMFVGAEALSQRGFLVPPG
jgi:hypothetical protein